MLDQTLDNIFTTKKNLEEKNSSEKNVPILPVRKMKTNRLN